MGVKRSVEQQFGPVAEEYATFNYHAAGPDLAPMLAAGEMTGNERVLDIGSGPGHTALLFATKAQRVVASDPTQAMLDQGKRLAQERGLDNVTFECTSAEKMPFADAAFDRVTSRQSAHHYADVPAALREVARVLAPTGRFVLIDTFSPEDDELVRDYRVSDWRDMFAEVNFELTDIAAWDIPLDFEDWVTRSRTPEEEVAMLRASFASASSRVRERFAVDDKGNWSVPVGLVVGTRKA